MVHNLNKLPIGGWKGPIQELRSVQAGDAQSLRATARSMVVAAAIDWNCIRLEGTSAWSLADVDIDSNHKSYIWFGRLHRTR